MRFIFVSFVTAMALVALMIVLASCGQDSTVSKRDRGSADVMNYPDGWSNIAHKCDGPNMVYASDHHDSSSSSIAVVKDDPRCTGGTSR